MEPNNKHSEIRKLIEEGDYENAFRQFIAKKPDSALTEEAERLYARFSQNEKDHGKQLANSSHWKTEQREIVDDLINLLDKADAPPTAYISFVRRPPLVAHLVLGRKEDLKVIADCFEQGDHLLLLNGMGGVGKSTLAGFYMERLGHRYRHIGWVRYTGNLANDLARDLTDQVALGFSEDLRNNFDRLDPETKFDTLMRHLERLPGPNLLIVDNLNTLEDAEDCAARSTQFPHGWKLLITAREHNEGMPHHSVGVLNLDDARRLFLRHCPQTSSEHTQLDSLLEHVGRHTLVVEFLSKTTKTQGWTPEKMLDRLKAQGLTHLDTKAEVATAHNKNQRANLVTYISALFDINLSTLTEPERWLLANLSVLPNFAHAYSVLEEMLFYPVPDSEGVTSSHTLTKPSSPDDLYPLLNDLTAKGYFEKLRTRRPTHAKLEEPAPEEDGFYMHPVMGEVIREKEKPDVVVYGEMVEYFIEKYLFDSSIKNPALAFHWIVYGEVLANRLIEGESTATIANNISRCLYTQGNLLAALEWQLRAKNILEKIVEENHPDLATFYNNLSLIYRRLNQIELAFEFLLKSITIRKMILAENNPLLAQSFNNLSQYYHDIGDLEEALNFQQKAKDIWEKAFGVSHPDIATSYGNIAMIYKDLKDFKEAINWQDKAIAVAIDTLGENHPDLGIFYNNLSEIYREQMEISLAIEWQKKSIDNREKTLPGGHYQLAMSYLNMATLLSEINILNEALHYIQQAVNIFQCNLPEGHPYIRNAFHWLAHIQARAAAASGEEQ
ncbi:MAG: ATP-binding protein [Saprospiraceae bacterium]|nr:ATP-binding protein [Saprospiraceae bacterium]